MSGLDAFRTVALLGNPAQGRVAECLLTLAAHLSARGLRVLVDAGSPLRFPADSTIDCEEGNSAEEADLLDRIIEVRLAPDSGEVNVCCDGILIGNLTHHDRLVIQRAATQVRLLHPPDYDHYRLVRSKLHWGRGEPLPAATPCKAVTA